MSERKKAPARTRSASPSTAAAAAPHTDLFGAEELVQTRPVERHVPGERLVLGERHVPGARGIPVHAGVVSTAVFGGPLDCYRYRLSRRWAPGPAVLFLMMNPSVADPQVDDRTVAKCRRYATRWGFGTLLVGNTFAYRATDQARLASVEDPIGPENDTHLLAMAQQAEQVVLAYGRPHHTPLRSRGPAVGRLLHAAGIPLHALRVSADGTPHHPLYLPETLLPAPWLPE